MDNKKALENFGFDLCDALIHEGATYASLILSKDGSVLYNYSTSKIWEGLYIESGYSKSCHLFQATKQLSEKSDSFTLFWDTVVPGNEISLYLNAKRDEKNVCHGVSFCNKNKNGVLEILTIAGRKCDFNFSSQVISQKEMIQRHLIALRNKHRERRSS